ncbi:hypothetical protein [Marinicella gelatinilytica]|uniref:hypothetical protein n=1 Tax=Marinicella gelatinilytica TaxID=2996017 RepID=UPI002260AB8D|nr:hypothetical protein [Marinicella gelatinilytica]MCX7545334.1 hypothetical protein [Marinicella gelatinilytica]
MFIRFSLKDLFFTLMLVFSSLGMVSASNSNVEIFNVDFNDLTPGSYIGDGGASVGEPSFASGITGQVFQQSPGENYLEVLLDPVTTNARSMRWDFLEGGEVTEGVVVIEYQFTPTALDLHEFGVREGGGSSKLFLKIEYKADGTFQARDTLGLITTIENTYTAGTTQDVVLTFDMDAGTSSMTINGNVIYSDREHDITDRGVGRLLTGFGNGSSNHPFYLDNINIYTPAPTTLLLEADFEDYMVGDFLGEGGASVDEPYNISNNLYTEIVTPGLNSDQALYLESETNGVKSTRWHFYDDVEVTTGQVVIEYDLEFIALDAFQFSVRENTTSSINFTTIRFTPGGKVSVYDESGFQLNVGDYQVNQVHHLRLTFDLDNGTYTVELDDVALVTGRSYGYSGERGIGKITLGTDSTTLAGTNLVIDNIQVMAIESNDLIFNDGFE